MNRRDLLKGAAVAPVVGLGTLLAGGSPAEAILVKKPLEGTILNLYPGGPQAPESQNGGDIVFKILDENNVVRTALVDAKTNIFISGVKQRYRVLLNETYTNHLVLLNQLKGLSIRVNYRSGLKAKGIAIDY